MRLQLAIDAPEHLALVPRLARYFDIIEAGTPLLKRFGLSAISTLTELGGGREVLADTKTVDGGQLEAEMAFAAGASMITVVAHAARATLESASLVARKYGGAVVFDMILDGSFEPVGVLPEEDPARGTWLALHSASDERMAGHGTEDHIARVADRRARGFRVSLAGGIGRGNLDRVLAVAPDIIVIGSRVTAAADPEAEARWIRQAVDRT
ncbi:MAG: orotidine 5'-phosphate decarboxylase / HUMPS family protein [Cellulomonas sp.]